ncbi:MAG: hypothetical protein AAF570_25880 [Bacteroidota bacterium]
MGTLTVQVLPVNAGNVTVRVYNAQSPGGSPLDETFVVNSATPLDRTWELDPAKYRTQISWNSGFHNIAALTEGNAIVINGNSVFFQVYGNGDESTVLGAFDCTVS